MDPQDRHGGGVVHEHLHDHGDADAGDIARELYELNERTGDMVESLEVIAGALAESDLGEELARLTDAVARVGDILDKRLA